MCQYAFFLLKTVNRSESDLSFFLLHPIALPGRIRIPATKYSATCFDLDSEKVVSNLRVLQKNSAGLPSVDN